MSRRAQPLTKPSANTNRKKRHEERRAAPLCPEAALPTARVTFLGSLPAPGSRTAWRAGLGAAATDRAPSPAPGGAHLHPAPSWTIRLQCLHARGGWHGQRLLVFSTRPGEPLTPGHGAGPICRASLWPRDSLHAMVLSIAQRQGCGPRARPALDAPSTAGAPRPSSSAGPPRLTNTPGTQMEKQKGAVQPLGSSITRGGGIMT